MASQNREAFTVFSVAERVSVSRLTTIKSSARHRLNRQHSFVYVIPVSVAAGDRNKLSLYYTVNGYYVMAPLCVCVRACVFVILGVMRFSYRRRGNVKAKSTLHIWFNIELLSLDVWIFVPARRFRSLVWYVELNERWKWNGGAKPRLYPWPEISLQAATLYLLHARVHWAPFRSECLYSNMLWVNGSCLYILSQHSDLTLPN